MQSTTRFRRAALGAVALSTAVAVSGAAPVGAVNGAHPPDNRYSAALTGAQEVPGPGDPDGAGVALVSLRPDGGVACLELSVADIARPSAVHIHEGAAGVAGPIVVDFTPTLGGKPCVSGIDEELLRRIDDNPAEYYVNVHNARFPAGAIRGQLFSPGALADEVALPAGFQPEGIAVADDGTFYAGSLADGTIFRGSLVTGEGERLTEAVEGRVAVGLALDGGRVWAAGGATGAAHVYDAETGDELGSWQLAEGETFVNDVVVAGDTAWFTDSRNAVLYGVRPGDDEVTTLPLTGDLVFEEGFNTNGIEVTEQGVLVVVQSNTGSLFSVDPITGVTTRIDLGDDSVVNGDGLLLHDGFLYVVQNRLNQIAKVELAKDLSSGTVVDRLTDPDFDVPTTVGAFGGRLWAVNARFGTPPSADTFYSVVSARI